MATLTRGGPVRGLSEDDKAVLVTLAQSGEIQGRIATVLGCYPGTVAYWAKKLGVRIRREKPKGNPDNSGKQQNLDLLGSETYQIDTKAVSLEDCTRHDRHKLGVWLLAIVKARTRPVRCVYLSAVYSEPTGEDMARAIHEAKLGPGALVADLGNENLNPAFRLACMNRPLILTRGWIPKATGKGNRMTKPDVERLFSNFARKRSVKVQVQAMAKLDQAERNKVFPQILATFKAHLATQGRLEEQLQTVKVPITV